MAATINTISIELLAEKLGGNLWVKGDLKRIYLDEGYNTKKMSTKTFVWQDENGDFKVSCKVECDNQPWQWCKSQEEQIKENVYASIQNHLSSVVYILANKEGLIVKWNNQEVSLNNCEFTYTIESAKKEIDNCSNYDSYITMDREEFEIEVKRLDEIEAKERAEKLASQPKKEPAKITSENKIHNEEAVNYSIGENVKHGRFGIGVVVADDGRIVEIKFSEGVKQLLKAFAKLEKI